MPLYHLSYDTKNCEKHFKGGYAEARNYILCVIASSNFQKIFSFTESTFLIKYKEFEPDRFFDFIQKNLSKYFYYSISVVALDNENKVLVKIIGNKELNDNLQNEIDNIDCSNSDKDIIDY